MYRRAAFVVLVLAFLFLRNTEGLSINYTPNTTLSAETANNTSTADSFTGTPNGNLAARNVSKLPVKSLMYAGANTKAIVATMGWWGKSSHIDIGYRSDDAAQVKRQLQDMQSRGFDGLTLAWYGSASTEVSNLSALAIMQQAEQMQGFTFALRPNEGIIKWFSNGMSPTDALIHHLKYASQTYFGSPAYMRVDGRPVLLFFGFESYAIDWAQVRASVPGNPAFIFRNANGFTHAESNGGFAWGPADDFSYLDWYYEHALPYQEKKANFGNAYKGFNDGLASWTAKRVIDQQCGQTWLKSMSHAGKYYAPGKDLQFIQVSTWNDYEEGTALETGVDNCLSVTASMAGSTLQWNLKGGGLESTIDHYQIYVSQDGSKLMPIAQVAAGNHSLNLGTYDLPSANYKAFVKAIGKPSIINHMSNGVTVAFPGATSPDYSVTSDRANVSLAAGEAASIALTMTPVNGFSDSLNFSCSGLPTATQCSFAPATVLVSGSAATTNLTLRRAQVAAVTHGYSGFLAGIGMAPLLVGMCLASRRRLLPAMAIGAVMVTTLACGGGAQQSASSHGTTQASGPNAVKVTVVANPAHPTSPSRSIELTVSLK